MATGTKLHTIQDDPKPGFPFIIPETMMPLFPLISLMGWMMVGIAFLVGLFVLSPAQTQFFSDAKAVREGAEVSSAFVNANVTIHTVETWVPQFKFLGLGFGLMAIAMALGTIAKRLRRMGKLVNAYMPPNLAPAIPPIPKRVRVMQLSTMMGIMLLMAALIIGLLLANGVVSSYYNHSIANELDPAQPGSELLNQLAIVSSFGFWLNPLRMVAMAMLFTSITIGLTLIIYNLRVQSNSLVEFSNRAKTRG